MCCGIFGALTAMLSFIGWITSSVLYVVFRILMILIRFAPILPMSFILYATYKLSHISDESDDIDIFSMGYAVMYEALIRTGYKLVGVERSLSADLYDMISTISFFKAYVDLILLCLTLYMCVKGGIYSLASVGLLLVDFGILYVSAIACAFLKF